MQRLFIIIIILLISCESPFDVPAHKGDKKVIKDPFSDNPILKIIPDSLNFDFVFPSQKKSFDFGVINISNDKYQIQSCDFYEDLFVCNNESKFLEPHELNNDTLFFSVEFTQDESGIYSDSLIIDNMFIPVLYANAVVPFVYAEDVLFGDVNENEITGKIIKIQNNSNDSVTLTSVYLEKNHLFRFSQTPDLPVTIAPKSSYDILIRFSHDNKGDYSDKLFFEIEEYLIIKNHSELSATVN